MNSTQVPKRGEKREKLLSKDYICVMLAATFACFLNYFFFAAFPLYLDLLGGTKFQVGMMTTVYSLAALAVRPVAGILSDKFGRVKLLIAGAFICAVTCLLFGVFAAIPMLLVLRALNGIGFGMHSTCAGAVAADVVPKSRLGEGIGYFGLYSTIGQALAPGIALAIVAGDTIRDHNRLFLISAAIGLLAMFADMCITYERKRKKSAAENTLTQSESADNKKEHGSAPLPKTILGFEYAVFAPVVVLILLYFGMASIMSFLTTFAKWKGFDNPGLYFTASAFGVLAARIIFGRVVDRRGADIIIIPGLIVLAVCMAVLPFVGTITALVALAVPLGLAQGAVMPTFNAMLFKRCSASRRGTASGAYFAAIDIGFAIGAPLLGSIADAFDVGYIYWVSAIFVALSLVLYLLLASDKRYYARQNNRR